jgi:hypothetical protein
MDHFMRLHSEYTTSSCCSGVKRSLAAFVRSFPITEIFLLSDPMSLMKFDVGARSFEPVRSTPLALSRRIAASP